MLAEADDADLEYGQGVTARIVELLTPAELIAFAAEETLEGLSVASVLETRVMGALDAHAAEAAGWAAGFADVLAPIRSPDRPHAREDAVGYDRVGLYHWDTLAVLTLLPLVRAGVALDPRWDVIAPFYGPPAMVREILKALPPERREPSMRGGGGGPAPHLRDRGLRVLPPDGAFDRGHPRGHRRGQGARR